MRMRTADHAAGLAKWRYAVAMNAAARHTVAMALRWLPVVLLCLPGASPAQSGQLTATENLPALVSDAVQYQVQDLKRTDRAFRYRVHRADSKEDTVRDLVESKDGNVARTLQRGGRPLTAEEDAAEQQRLHALTAEGLARHRKNGAATDRYSEELISALPRAMTFTLVADQPQLPRFEASQVVLDYSPNTAFHPASTTESLLTGLAGRMWIDAATHHLLRIEVRIIKNLNLALGLLARVYQGGTLVYEQHPVAAGQYAYTHIDIQVVLRELMVKTVPYHSTLDATDIVLLPAVPTLAEAVNLLTNNTGARP